MEIKIKIGIDIDDTTLMDADIDEKEIVRVNNWNEIYDEIEKYKNLYK